MPRHPSRDQDYLAAIRDLYARTGSPSERDVAAQLHVSGPSARRHILRLELAGQLVRMGQRRLIRPLRTAQEPVDGRKPRPPDDELL